jgi:hypothetical protein
MEFVQAKRIGGKMVCRIAIYALIILETVWLLKETEGDFANGIILFLYAQFNPFVFGFFIVLFLTSWFWGRNAGRDILIHKKSYLTVGLKHGLLASVMMLAYLLIASLLNDGIQAAFRAIGIILPAVIVPMAIIWLLGARLIKAQDNEQ